MACHVQVLLILDLFNIEITFFRTMDVFLTEQFIKAKTLDEIRTIYISTDLDNKIINAIERYSLARSIPKADKDMMKLTSYQAHHIARILRKWVAREKMLELGLDAELNSIHQDNQMKYGNIVGPTSSFLIKKYGCFDHVNTNEAINACYRFRSNNKF